MNPKKKKPTTKKKKQRLRFKDKEDAVYWISEGFLNWDIEDIINVLVEVTGIVITVSDICNKDEVLMGLSDWFAKKSDDEKQKVIKVVWKETKEE